MTQKQIRDAPSTPQPSTPLLGSSLKRRREVFKLSTFPYALPSSSPVLFSTDMTLVMVSISSRIG